MKLFIIPVILLFVLEAKAQNLKNFVVPKGYQKVLEARGDLDRDGIEETVFAYNTIKNDSVGLTRELYICKNVNGVLKLWKQNTSILWDSQDCGFCTDNGVNLTLKIKNFTLVVEQTFWHSTRHTSIFKNVFRYQNNDWYLIGSTYNDTYNCGYDHTYDINFSTKQVQVTYGGEECDDDQPAYKKSQIKFNYPFKTIPKMDGFVAGKVELSIPNSKKYFYY